MVRPYSGVLCHRRTGRDLTRTCSVEGFSLKRMCTGRCQPCDIPAGSAGVWGVRGARDVQGGDTALCWWRRDTTDTFVRIRELLDTGALTSAVDVVHSVSTSVHQLCQVQLARARRGGVLGASAEAPNCCSVFCKPRMVLRKEACSRSEVCLEWGGIVGVRMVNWVTQFVC